MKPEFYLSTAGELDAFAEPRAVSIAGTLVDENANNHLLVLAASAADAFEVTPEDSDVLVLSPKLAGTSIAPVSGWPLSVYVSRPRNRPLLPLRQLSRNDVEIIGWGKIFESRDEATSYWRGFKVNER